MKVFVTGINGQLGYDVGNELLARGHEVLGCGRSETTDSACPYVKLDITDKAAVEKAIIDYRPDVVIHCAAWTAVDAAEDEANKPQVYAINVLGTRYIARACKAIDATMIYISTDYVFDGSGDTPWEPDCTDFHPLNYYGLTKLLGEQAVQAVLDKYYVVRTSWVFGAHGNNFVKTMLKLAETHDEVRVVNDQIGAPTYTPDLARLLVDMAQTDKYGVYHACNEGGYISWYDFCCEIYRQAGITTNVIPVSTEEYGTAKAIRPQNSRFALRKISDAGFKTLRLWIDTLRDIL